MSSIPVSQTTPQQLSIEQRQQILGAEVAKHVANGYTATSVIGTTATLTKNKRIGWFWNTVLTLVTSGLWLIVVVFRVVNRKRITIVLTVDPYGKIGYSHAGTARTSQ